MNKTGKLLKKGKTNESLGAVRIEVDYSKAFPSEYSNYASISHSSNEYFIDFCIIAPPYNLKDTQPVIMAQPVARIVIPRSLAPLLIDAMNSQITKQYEEELATKKESDNG